MTDPAADITAYLLGSQQELEAQGRAGAGCRRALDDLALMHLSQAFPKKRAEQYLRRRHPRVGAGEPQGGRGRAGRAADRTKTASSASCSYVGRRTISKYGCSGCHDIPGFEDAKPIGTGLADWGRKDPSKLAFEQIAGYIARTHAEENGTPRGTRRTRQRTTSSPTSRDMEPDEGYFMEKLSRPSAAKASSGRSSASRAATTTRRRRTRRYNERLRMPQFPLEAGRDRSRS